MRARVVVLAALVGCNPYAEEVAPAPDASVASGPDAEVAAASPPPAIDSEAGSPISTDAGDAGNLADSGTATSNLLTNGDFETGDSTGWLKNSATMNASSSARNGTYSTRICTTIGGSSIFTSINIGGAPAGTKYEFDVWFHAPDSGNPTTAAQCNLETFSSGGKSLAQAFTDASISSLSWQSCHVSLTLANVAAAGTTLRAGILEGASGCMLADDAVLTKQ